MVTLKKLILSPSLLTSFLVKKSGAIAPIVALVLPVVLGVVGLGTDVSLWMVHKRNLQLSADSAALAAGWEIAKESSEHMLTSAIREAQRNGYDESANGDLTIEIIEQTDDGIVVRATVSQDSNAYFSRILFKDPVGVTADADVHVSDFNGKFCVLSLSEEDSSAVSILGSAEFIAPDCGLAINSTDDKALSLLGSVEVDVGTVRISGGYEVGGSVEFNYNLLKTNVAALEDPYEDLEIPSYSSCGSGKPKAMSISSSATLSPGVYCGGMSISGIGDVTFEPGTYIIDGGNFKVTGGGTLYGEGVTFILTGSGTDYAQVDISGGRSVYFSAPLAGEDFEGVVFFQDRDAPQKSNLQNKIVGTSNIILDGVAYFPSQGLWFGGDANFSGMANPCTKLIAHTVTFSGTPLIANNCSGKAIEDVGNPSVHLIR
ncbi:MAG: hypothetical protein KAJ29_05350 [Alphaproteobacteria bacterium]|nr:hypothetical protein [Alphaproteobacteria bacterium]